MTLNYLTAKDNTMRGLFFIVKGQYRRSRSGDDTIGYDPFNPDTPEWYMLIDNRTFTCVSCGSDLQKVLNTVCKVIKRHKGVANRYFKQVSMSSSVTSSHSKELYKRVFEKFGDYYEEEIEEMEDRAYEEMRLETPLRKSKKLMAKQKSTVEMTYKQEKTLVIKTPTPKIGFGIKKLSLV